MELIRKGTLRELNISDIARGINASQNYTFLVLGSPPKTTNIPRRIGVTARTVMIEDLSATDLTEERILLLRKEISYEDPNFCPQNIDSELTSLFGVSPSIPSIVQPSQYHPFILSRFDTYNRSDNGYSIKRFKLIIHPEEVMRGIPTVSR